MKTVVCFGDSNTWGEATEPRPDDRYGPEERWTGILQALLGRGWCIQEEGLCSRTSVCDDPIEFEYDKNGARSLPVALHTHKPVDLVVLMLGTNDLKTRYNRSPEDIAAGVGVLAGMVRVSEAGPGKRPPDVLIVCPPAVGATVSPMYVDMFAGARAKSLMWPALFRAVAEKVGAAFMDAGSLVSASPFDGIHLAPDAHRTLGHAIAGCLIERLGR